MDVCLTDRTIFEVDLKALPKFINEISLYKIVDFTRYTGPNTGKSFFKIAKEPTGGQYKHEHMMCLLCTVIASGVDKSLKNGTDEV